MKRQTKTHIAAAIGGALALFASAQVVPRDHQPSVDPVTQLPYCPADVNAPGSKPAGPCAFKR